MNNKYPRTQKVIISQIHRGSGTVHSPNRRVTQVHTTKGKFIAEWDDYREQKTIERLEKMGERIV